MELSDDNISELPEEIIVHIVSLLTMKEAVRTSVLSKRWQYVWAHTSDDHISELPEEIIVHIVSLLTMKEAVRTSVLSKRWQYVWAHNSDDHVSELPEEIIVLIVSQLTMKEAGRTSVLSKCWQYVWAYNPVLNFDGSDTLDKLVLSYEELMELERPRYLSWVNQVVGSYKGPTIDAFKVLFYLSVTDRCDIDNWLKFAMEKRVKRLDLEFQPLTLGTEHTCYTISGLLICNSLTSLRLVDVNISSEVFQNFLLSCPVLDSVMVICSESLEALEVSAVTLKLRKLFMAECHGMKIFDICAPNLEEFRYYGPKISIPFKRFPKLIHLSLYGENGEYLSNNTLEFSNFLLQLESLNLCFGLSVKHIMKSVNEFPQCKRLEELSVIVEPYFDEELSSFLTLIKACPNLQRFKMELRYWQGPVCDRECKEVEIEACPHGNLEMVVIKGFVGHAIDLDFVMHLIKNCVALKKIVVHICPSSDFMDASESEIDATIEKARMQAEKLQAKLKHEIELIIII